MCALSDKLCRMTSLTIELIFISAFFHAGWNLLARSQRAEHTLLQRALWLAAAFGLPLAIICLASGHTLPGRAWVCALLTAAVFGVYFLGLARAYGSGDFTVVYPISRGLPILVVGLGDVLRGHSPTGLGWLGMACVAAACAMMPLHSFRNISIKHYANRNMLWIGTTAAAVVAFTLIDKVGSEAVPQGPASAAIYNGIIYSGGAVMFTILVKLFGMPTENRESVGWWRPALAALATFASYFLILWSYQLADHAGYVVALRQFSIVIGVVIGIVWFREKGAAIRISAACLMLLGMLLVTVFG